MPPPSYPIISFQVKTWWTSIFPVFDPSGSLTHRTVTMAPPWRVWMVWLRIRLSVRIGSCWWRLKMVKLWDLMLVSSLCFFFCFFSIQLFWCSGSHCNTARCSCLQVLGVTFLMQMKQSFWILRHGEDCSNCHIQLVSISTRPKAGLLLKPSTNFRHNKSNNVEEAHASVYASLIGHWSLCCISFSPGSLLSCNRLNKLMSVLPLPSL